MSAGSPGLFRHTWAPDNGSPSRLEGIHVGVLKCGGEESVKFTRESCRRNVVDQTADGEDGLVVPSCAVRNPAIYEVSAREQATSPPEK